MKTTIWIIIIFISFSSWSQTKSEIKIIEKVLGKDFTKAEAEVYYHKVYPLNAEVENSTVVLNDTTGLYKNGEYLMFRDPLIYCKEQESFKYVKESPVSVNEYFQFVHWVRDSIARETLLYDLEDDEDAIKYIHTMAEYYDYFRDSVVKIDSSARYHNSDLFNLNWETKLDYKDPELIPILSDFYLPQPERFYQIKEFDDRKIVYSYKNYTEEYPKRFVNELILVTHPQARDFYGLMTPGDSLSYPSGLAFNSKEDYEKFQEINRKMRYRVINEIVVSPDFSVWAASSNHAFDASSVLSNLYIDFFKEAPITGIVGTQAQAFCNWKEKMLNNDLNSKGINFRVKISLPTSSENVSHNLMKNQFNAFVDANKNWKISSAEYQDFIDFVVDSTLREEIYKYYSKYGEYGASSYFLDFEDQYFDESSLEYTDFDPSDNWFNRHQFPFNYKIKIDKYVDWICEENNYVSKDEFIRKTVAPNDKLLFKWFYIENMLKSKHCTPVNFVPGIDPDPYKVLDTVLSVIDGTKRTIQVGKEGMWYGLNDYGRNSGVVWHGNKGRFIIDVNTDILPEGYHWGEEVNINNLTYEQAIAFYRWKYPIHKASPKSDWTQFVLPSEEQFEKMKNNEVLEEINISMDLPSPTFRYVVHFYDN